jgi:hypothetical protein
MATPEHQLTVSLIEANEWLVSPENDNAPMWLRDLVIATRDWVLDVRKVVESRH